MRGLAAIIAVVLVCLGIGAVAASAAERGGKLPKLTQPDAEHYAKQSVKSKFPYFSYYSGKVIRCNHRVSNVRILCDVRWWVGDSSAKGKVTVWYRWKRGDVWWQSRGKVKLLNEYCMVQGGSKSHCTDTKTWGK